MAKKKKDLSPLMEQYWSLKSAHVDKILFFRMGDFYEMFYEDAQLAAPILGIALTSRNKKSNDHTPMCGMPHHSIAPSINKLLSLGHKVAICDQVEDAKLAKGLVKRAVTRVLSPGMVYDPEKLDQEKPNYIVAFSESCVAFLDTTTGESFYYNLDNFTSGKELIDALEPVEMVFSEGQASHAWLEKFKGVKTQHDSIELEKDQVPEPCGRLLSYAIFMQGHGIRKSLRIFEKRTVDRRMRLSAQTLRHLEIFATYRGEKEGTFFQAINRTRTAPGARCLRQWVQFPLMDLQRIRERQQKVERWSQDLSILKEIRKKLYHVGDIERKLGKVTQPHCHPRDLKALGESLQWASEVLTLASGVQEGDPDAKSSAVRDVEALASQLRDVFVDDIPVNFKEGAFIAKGVDDRLDDLIGTATQSQKMVQDMEAREREITGISSLKIRYNGVFGYYIEVTNTHKSKVPKDRYMRKQTLTNAERYVTDPLNELEKKVLNAKSSRANLELEIFGKIRDEVCEAMTSLFATAKSISLLDVESSLAWLGLEHDYCKPSLVESGSLIIESGRHPVIEQFMDDSFVANDITIEPHQGILLTGPNMAGKSTIMRQVGLIALLGQMGSFVPAASAQLPLVDQIFTRIGASDFLTEGLSTFMVEMKETAEMVAKASERSLVILDEVGRGTSTYDGLSLAQSLLEYFVGQIRPMILFATHYHELVSLEAEFAERLVNYHMAISDRGHQLHFLYQLTRGPALKSYGIQVAQIAGIPKKITDRARWLLQNLEKEGPSASSQLGLFQQVMGPSLEDGDEPVATGEKSPLPAWVDDLQGLDIQQMTPLDALLRISKWQKELS